MNDPTKTAPYFCHESPTFVGAALDKPVGIAVDSATGQIFYDEDNQAGGDNFHPLSSVSFLGKGKSVVLPKLLDPQGLDIDSQTQKVYYTEHHGGRVGSVDYDGKNNKVLHSWETTSGPAICGEGDSMNCPSDVKVDVGADKIFVTVEGHLSTNNAIVSMYLNGTGFKVLKSGITRAYGLTLDKKTQTIYYISGGHGGFIGNMTYNGEKQGKVLDNLDWPYMLDFDSTRELLVYSTTSVGAGTINTVKPDGTNVTHAFTMGLAPMGVSFGKIPA